MVPRDELSPVIFTQQHPELHHYTDFNGLQGIITSNTLWATHFAYLNDSTEVTFLKEALTALLNPLALDANFQMSQTGNRQARRALRSQRNIHGVRCVTRAYVEAFFHVAFGGEEVEPLSEPYVTSFCAHSENQSYERRNGLLSQWRAYGGSNLQRFCIVFDTSKLISLLEKEWAAHYWTYMYLNRVNYGGENITIDGLFPDLAAAFEKAVARIIRGGRIEADKDSITALLHAAPWFKHEGFFEEQEARIVAIPGKESMAKLIVSADPEYKILPLKTVQEMGASAGSRPHIALFEKLGATLPIVRVIVGPSRHQKENFERARSLMRNKAPLHQSETPFIG